MDRSNSISSNASSSSESPSSSRQGSSVNPFAYQTRLLERTASLSRSNSLSTRFPQPANPASPQVTRRWTPTHRVANSMDTVRGKWEERARTAELAAVSDGLNSPIKVRADDRSSADGPTPATISKRSSWTQDFGTARRYKPPEQLLERPLPSLPPKEVSPIEDGVKPSPTYRTPPHLKRHTLPAPVSLPLSPETTGSFHNRTPVSPSFATPTPARVYIPASTNLESSSISAVKRLSDYAIPSPSPTIAVRKRSQSTLPSLPSTPGHSDILDTSPFPLSRSSASSSTSDLHSPLARQAIHTEFSSNTLRRQDAPADISQNTIRKKDVPSDFSLNTIRRKEVPTDFPRNSLRKDASPALSSTLGRTSSFSRASRPNSLDSVASPSVSPPSTPALNSSPMTPTPYRSSYLANKKSGTYGSMVVGRKLGRHLPRIASGDGNDYEDMDTSEEQKRKQEEEERLAREEERRQQERRERRRRWNIEHGREIQQDEVPVLAAHEVPSPQELIIPGITGADDVQGLRGRLRLSKNRSTPNSPGFASPLPSTRLGIGLWADVQRHLLQAYEYLCHVGEAQQWIEGCLGEELGFGVVEMEEGLRNGVVLAKLVRAFEGEAAVKRIYDVSEVDFYAWLEI